MDPHILYEAAVQDAVSEARFLDRLARRLRGRPARSLREDFCGTFWLGYEWIALSPDKTAAGLDLDAEALESGRERHASRLTDEERRRAHPRQGNVLKDSRGRFDLVFAGNFSYFALRERSQMLSYFRSVRRSLNRGGVFVLDHLGGPETMKSSEEITWKKAPGYGRFQMSWRQESFDAFTARGNFRLSFRRKPGSPWRTFSTYAWRLWTLPEIMDLLREAGFSKIEIHWQTDAGEFRTRRASEAGVLKWLAYVTARG